MSPPALILFGHGARDPEWARPFHRLQQILRARQPGRRVELAFLDFIEPPLDEAIGRLVADGCQRIRVVPIFIAQGGHVKADLYRLTHEARQRWPDLDIESLTAIGEAGGVLEAIADFALGDEAAGAAGRPN